MKFDLLTILKHFAVEDERLVRKLATGHCRPVTLIDRGRLAVVVGGVRLYGPEVAYACLYRVVPMFPIVQVDGDPLNMREDNLMPARLKRLRFRSIPVAGGFRHPLSRAPFRTSEECHHAWVGMARQSYQRDKAMVRQMEDEAQGRKPVVPRRVLTAPRKVYAPKKVALERPEAVEGRSWHWWDGSWLSLPLPVHCSDDWMVRAQVVSENPEAQFVYDPVAQRTVSVI